MFWSISTKSIYKYFIDVFMLTLAALVLVSYRVFQHVAAVFLTATTDTTPAPHEGSKDTSAHLYQWTQAR